MKERFEKIILAIQESKNSAAQQYLIDLINIVRPYDFKNIGLAKERLWHFIELLQLNPAYKKIFSDYIVQLLRAKNHIRLFTDLGISANTDFFSELRRRINSKILPPAIDNSELTDLLQEIFHKVNDHRWVSGVDNETWMALFSMIELPKTKSLILPDIFHLPIINSLQILGNRIASLGLEPEILSRMPHVEKYHSDFLALSSEIHHFLNAYQAEQQIEANDSLKQINVIITQCRNTVQRIRKTQKSRGTSIKQVYILLRITQNIDRLQKICQFLDIRNIGREKQLSYTVDFFKQLVYAESSSKNVSSHLKENTDLLAYQIIEHTSFVGKKYIAVTKKQYFKAIWSAMKGGLIIVAAVIIKAYIGELKGLALLPSSILYSLNYAAAFVTIYLTHSALATKQPSMTASYIANALSDTGKKGETNLQEAADTIMKLSRSQFASIIGNLIVVFPVTFLLAWAYHYFVGEFFFPREMAIKALTENHPFKSLLVLYATITGFFLFLSGLITGYYENMVVEQQIPKRIREHKFLLRYLSPKKLNSLAYYIEKHAGSLAGNIFLGFFLGSAAAIGKVTGLPFDIRHITISAGNFGLGAYTLLDNNPIADLLILSFIGVLLVGLINIVVSFSLTLIVAIKSLRISFNKSSELINLLWAHFIFSTRDFFYPPKEKNSTFVNKTEK